MCDFNSKLSDALNLILFLLLYYSNRIFIVITQRPTFSTVLTVSKDTPKTLEENSDDIYTVRYDQLTYTSKNFDLKKKNVTIILDLDCFQILIWC